MKSYVYVFEECKMNRKFFSISSAAMILSAMSLASCESVHAGKNEMPMETVEADVSKFEKANPDFVSETLRTPDQLKRISKSGQEYSHKTLIVTLEDTVTPAQIDELAADFGLDVGYKYSMMKACSLSSPVELTDKELDKLIENLEKDGRVISVSKDYIYYLDRSNLLMSE